MSLPTDEFAGRLIITWPKGDVAVVGRHVFLADADTGEQITSAFDADVVIHADVREVVTATVTMLVGEDDKPLPNKAKPIISDDGENLRTGVFQWVVAEMRVAQ